MLDKYCEALKELADDKVVELLNGPLIGLIKELQQLWQDRFREGMQQPFYAVIQELLDRQTRQQVEQSAFEGDLTLVWLWGCLNERRLSEAIYMIMGNQEHFRRFYTSRSKMLNVPRLGRVARTLEGLERSVVFDLKLSSCVAFESLKDQVDPFYIKEPSVSDITTLIATYEQYHVPAPWSRIRSLFQRTNKSVASVEEREGDEVVTLNIEGRKRTGLKASLFDMKITLQSLASQNYSCKRCGNGLSTEYAKTCSMTGQRFCKNCIGEGKRMNPIRIVQNWDFNRYSMSEAGAQQAATLCYTEAFDLEARISRQHWGAISNYELIRKLRGMLHGMAQEAEGGEEVARMFWPKLHFMQSARLYTVEDLIEMQQGAYLTRVLYPLARELCRARGIRVPQ